MICLRFEVYTAIVYISYNICTVFTLTGYCFSSELSHIAHTTTFYMNSLCQVAIKTVITTMATLSFAYLLQHELITD